MNPTMMPVPQVKVDGYAVLGSHDDTIIGLGFEGINYSNGRTAAAGSTSLTSIASAASSPGDTADQTTTETTLASAKHQRRVVVEKKHSVENTSRGERESRGAAGGTSSNGNDKDREDMDEQEQVFGLVVLSACIDGTVRAWETCGMSEKYRMRHPPDEEVTSMLVLPGGVVMATGILDVSKHSRQGRSFRYISRRDTVWEDLLGINQCRMRSTLLCSCGVTFIPGQPAASFE